MMWALVVIALAVMIHAFFKPDAYQQGDDGWVLVGAFVILVIAVSRLCCR